MTAQFDPPEGLNPGENIVWVRHKIGGLWIRLLSISLGIGGLLATGFALALNPILGLSAAILVAAGYVLLIRTHRRSKRTRYFLTNQRIVESRSSVLIKEVPFSLFSGKPSSRFLVKRRKGSKAGADVYAVRVRHPASGDTLMDLRLHEGWLRELEARMSG